MTEVTYRQAIAMGIADAMREDESVFMIGEDIGAAGGAFKTVDGVFDEFGPRRVRDTPISEQAIVGCAIGAALKGLRPIAEIMFADFAGICFDGIANQLAKYRYMTDGQVKVPVTIRMANGAGGGFAAQHSQAAENWFLNVAGLKIVAPATPADVYGALLSAVRDDDPVLVYEHKALFGRRGELQEGRAVELGTAEVVREGGDVTVVATQLMRHRAEEAAESLAGDGVSVEVIDLRSLAPIDWPTLKASVAKTNRLVCVQESQPSGSWGATVVATLLADSFDEFDAPPVLVGGDDTPIPYAEELEDAWLPSVDRIAAAVRGLVAY
jgi:pyruvate/2-oxoglutarate/acetoin dehydrogenase E1 component